MNLKWKPRWELLKANSAWSTWENMKGLALHLPNRTHRAQRRRTRGGQFPFLIVLGSPQRPMYGSGKDKQCDPLEGLLGWESLGFFYLCFPIKSVVPHSLFISLRACKTEQGASLWIRGFCSRKDAALLLFFLPSHSANGRAASSVGEHTGRR